MYNDHIAVITASSINASRKQLNTVNLEKFLIIIIIIIIIKAICSAQDPLKKAANANANDCLVITVSPRLSGLMALCCFY